MSDTEHLGKNLGINGFLDSIGVSVKVAKGKGILPDETAIFIFRITVRIKEIIYIKT